MRPGKTVFKSRTCFGVVFILAALIVTRSKPHRQSVLSGHLSAELKVTLT